MVSGIPFSKDEIRFVKEHSPHEFPSIIARGLALKFREYNGGYRSKEAVADLMRAIERNDIRAELDLKNVSVDIKNISEELKEPKPKTPDLRKGRKSTKKKLPA